jgi:hypothetical protein
LKGKPGKVAEKIGDLWNKILPKQNLLQLFSRFPSVIQCRLNHQDQQPMNTTKTRSLGSVNRGVQSLLLHVAAGLGIAVIGYAQPTITQQPTNQSVSLGAAAFFSVTAKSASPIAYQWCHQGTPLLWATNASLALTNIQMTDAGPYTVALTDATGITNSNPATLEVDPTFTKITSGDIVTDKGHWHGAAWADYNNDGFVDLVINQHEPAVNNILYRNNGDGTFARILDPSLQGIRTGSGIYARC